MDLVIDSDIHWNFEMHASEMNVAILPLPLPLDLD